VPNRVRGFSPVSTRRQFVQGDRRRTRRRRFPPRAGGRHACARRAVDDVGDAASGLASGLINTTQQIGGARGLAALTAVATSRTNSMTGDIGLAAALNEGFQAALLVATGIVLAAVAGTAMLARSAPGAGRRPLRDRRDRRARARLTSPPSRPSVAPRTVSSCSVVD
jgi:hypothetical protein